ncbi:hypothetical protein L1887_37467 [Cichorium endivia]|nr:hypothetical protein L1887_37467 [Cichorium endivia]
MNTPHHQMNIHHTPDDRHNPGSRLPNDRHNPSSRLPNDRHTSDDRHNPDSRLPNDRRNPGGHLPDDRHSLGGHQPDRHNPDGRIDGRMPGYHNAEYNKHHVKESLTTRVTKLICGVFLSILFTVGLATFILWLSLRPHRPRFYIQEFSIQNLADPNGFSTARITFNVTARNPNLDIGIYYNTMNLTIYHQEQTIAETPLLFPFYQSPKNAAVIYGTLSGSTLRIDKVRWMQFMAARKHGAVPFRVDVAALIHFKVSAWDSRHHKMHANCEIGVGPSGTILGSDKKKKCPVYFT